MGKENITFLTAWMILGNVFATFSTDPEPTAISGTAGSRTEFGKSGTRPTPTAARRPRPLQGTMRRARADISLIARRCFALTENNPVRRAHIFSTYLLPTPFSCQSADLHHISCHPASGWRKSFVCEKQKTEKKNNNKKQKNISREIFELKRHGGPSNRKRS